MAEQGEKARRRKPEGRAARASATPEGDEQEPDERNAETAEEEKPQQSGLFFRAFSAVKRWIALIGATALVAVLGTAGYIGVAGTTLLDRTVTSVRLGDTDLHTGLAYVLPKKTISVSASLSFAGCDVVNEGGETFLLARFGLGFSSPVEVITQDGDAFYAIDVGSSLTWFAQSKLEVGLTYLGFVETVNYETEAADTDLALPAWASPMAVKMPVEAGATRAEQCGAELMETFDRMVRLDPGGVPTDPFRTNSPEMLRYAEHLALKERFDGEIDLRLNPRPLQPDETGVEGLEAAGLHVAKSVEDLYGPAGPGLRSVLAGLAMSLSIVPTTGEMPRSGDLPERTSGILYRMPREMKARTCMGGCDEGRLLEESVILFPQLGKTVGLPLVARPFLDIETRMNASDEDGRPVIYSFGAKPQPPKGTLVQPPGAPAPADQPPD